jgi:hypothetical protein
MLKKITELEGRGMFEVVLRILGLWRGGGGCSATLIFSYQSCDHGYVQQTP